VFRPYVKHLLGAHIEGQYQKLYSLYLGELVVQRKNYPRDELSELREITSDIRDYSETLLAYCSARGSYDMLRLMCL
jgi:hypothetical protein